MGGNLFNLGRLPRAEYLALEAELRVYLDERFGELYRIPRYYDAKPDFGDVDIVISDEAMGEGGWAGLRAQIVDDLGLTRTTTQGPLFSTVYRDFQVDYFRRPRRYFESTYNFLCFNDIGNLLGKIFHRLNLKYGERGLQWVFRRAAPSNYRLDLEVSVDLERIFAYIGVDHGVWCDGFADLESMYRWVMASPHFSPAPYLDPGSNTRRRAKHRTTVARFISYLESHPDVAGWEELEREDRAVSFERVCAFFPEAKLEEAVAVERLREERVALIAERFDGHLVMRLLPELSGKALGSFIGAFKASFGDFEAEVVEMTPEAVERRVLAFGQQWEG